MKKRIVVLILCIAFVLSFADITVFAASGKTTYSTLDSAADYLRQQFVERSNEISLEIKKEAFCKNGTVTNALLTEVSEALIGNAFSHTGVPDEGDYLLRQFERYEWYANYVSGILTLTINISYYTTKEQENTVDRLINRIVSELALEDKTAYERVLAIYDYITSNVTYSTGDISVPIKHTCYNAVAEHNAVCQGYALLFYRLCLECGIDTRIISGRDDMDEGHDWNIVKLGNKYFYADTTWDTGKNHTYFLKGINDFSGHVEYETDGSEAIYNIADYSYDRISKLLPKSDFDGNGVFSTDDAIYILYAYFFPLDYPMMQKGDVNGDGAFTQDDAIYLLYHYFFPSQYPVK